MDKPIVFFSHSSRDARALRLLKNKFVEGTGGSIDVFLSSDGQSIPLGRNWVHSIEKALQQAKVMFVFVSPDSLHSDWLFFESGYAYSRDIEVVPVGFMGVDLTVLPPPLGLLQGFNVFSAEGLNNIVAQVNKKLGHTHAPCFSDQDYKDICRAVPSASNTVLGKFGQFVDSITVFLRQSTLSCATFESIDRAEAALKRQKTKYRRVGKDFMELHGMTFSAEVPENDPLNCGLLIRLDPGVADVNLPIVQDIANDVCKARNRGIHMQLEMNSLIRSERARYRLTGRLHGTGTKVIADDRLERGNLRFFPHGASGNVLLNIDLLSNSVPPSEVGELIELLFEKRVLFMRDK
jgi:hypothetical protein